jgi:putative heme-binding domain-containing protein
MKSRIVLALILPAMIIVASGADQPESPLPVPAPGWSIELVYRAPRTPYPTAIVAAPDGTLYVGSDPMDMPGPPTEPADRVLALKQSETTIFADKLWSVMGLEWCDGTLYVVHAPFLSAFRDTDRDGKADSRIDLVTGLGPKVPGFNGINDHVAGGIRRGMDGFLYIAVGDKGIPRAVGRDGRGITLEGGGVIRVRADGTGLEVVSTGECNPMSVALSDTDEIFTYGNDDDSKKWPNSLTHHIVGGHYGYPYQFLTAPSRTLPVMAGEVGGAGAQGLCYNDDGLPAEYRGNLFFCDWGLQTVRRFEIKKAGGTYALAGRSPFVSKGDVRDFRPFSLAVTADGRGLWLVDWAYNGWLATGPPTGRLYRLSYSGAAGGLAATRPTGEDQSTRVRSLDHPALSVRLESQRILERQGAVVVPALIDRLGVREPETGRLHALWALDAIGGPEARRAIGAMLGDPSARVRLQAARSVGIRADRTRIVDLFRLLADRDPAVRREAAIAAGRMDELAAPEPLYRALGDADPFAAWSIRQAIRRLNAWNTRELVAALLDDRRLEPALRLTDEAWSVPVVTALTEALTQTEAAPIKGRIVANLAGLYHRYPEWSGQWFGTNPLAGPFPRKMADWSTQGMKGVREGLAAALADPARTVRFQAIIGLGEVGSVAAPLLRSALLREPDAANQALLTETLGTLGDPLAEPIFTAIVSDGARQEAVRSAAISALAKSRDPQSLRARFALLYDPNAPAALVARALPDLASAGFLPPNDLASFLEHSNPSVRAAALLSVNVKKSLAPELQQSVIDRLDDREAGVRQAALLAIVALQLRPAIPRLIAMAADRQAANRMTVIEALCGMPDARAFSLYLDAIQERNPRLRRGGEKALLAVRDRVRNELESALSAGTLNESALLTLERVIARFEPVRDWRVIGPFPRATPSLFIGEPTIDFTRAQRGALGRSIGWRARHADPVTGRVDLGDFSPERFVATDSGYNAGGSPDWGAFAVAEIDADRASPALLLIGSSGTLLITINEQPVFHYQNAEGRAYAADSDLVRVALSKGKNRILVLSRQGIGPWAFGLEIARVAQRAGPRGPGVVARADLRQFALTHDGDLRKGEAIFLDAKGIGCVRCHRAAGRGSATIGPDLTGLALKYDREEVIRSILEPSHRIAPGYQPVVVATRDGNVATGVVRSETESTLELADADAQITQIPKSDIEVRRVGHVSIMPAKLVERLSPGEFADLVSFLLSLKSP